MRKNTKAVMLMLAASLALAACGSKPAETSAPVSEAAESSAEQTEAAKTEETEETKAEETEAEASEAETEAEAEEKTEAAEETEAETEAQAETAEAEKADAVEALDYEFTEYSRYYPGLSDDDVKFYSDAQLISITSEGYDSLQKSLDEMNTIWKQHTDHYFAEEAKDLSAHPLDDFFTGMLPFNNSLWADVNRADSLVFSFTTTSSNWYGGAHPNSYQFGYSLDAKTGRLLELQDVVTDYKAFYDEVVKALENHENKDGFFEDWKETVDAIFNTNPDFIPKWVITRDGIDVWFNTYEIAPYAAGPVFLSFPAADYSDLIRAEYFPEDIPAPKILSSSPYSGSFQVWELVDENGSVEHPDFGPINYKYNLPQIYAEKTTPYIDEINKELEELKTSVVDPQLKALEEGEIPSIYYAGYSSVTWKGITSICVNVATETDEFDWRCWNLKADGTEASNAEVLALFDLKPEEFTEKAKEVLARMCDWELSEDEAVAAGIEELKKQTLSESNVNADLPLFITKAHGLGFIGGVYTPAGAGYMEDAYELYDTEHRPDGLKRVSINPRSEDNYVKKGDSYEITDEGSGEKYILDNNTVIIKEGTVCYDDGCDAVTWVERYLANPAFSDFDQNNPYSALGFAPGDILDLLVDENNHIGVVSGIGYWD